MKAASFTEKTCLHCNKSFLVRNCYVKRGQGKFCSVSCATTYRNLTDNPAWRPEVRAKISLNHADVSGKKHPMYGKRGILSPLYGRTSPLKGKPVDPAYVRRGSDSPSYIDGRSKFKGDMYRKVLLASGRLQECECCGERELDLLHVHHIDGNRENNELHNLMWACRRCHLGILHRYLRDKNGRFTCSVLLNNEGGNF